MSIRPYKMHLSPYYPNSGGEDTDSCQGDYGGPILSTIGGQQVQVGVASWGEGCAKPDTPGVYSRISGAYDWIAETACSLGASEFCGGDASPLPPKSKPTTMGKAASMFLRDREEDWCSFSPFLFFRNC
jgi:secreted trypsin-like serine protease